MQSKINIERIRQFSGEVKEALVILRGYMSRGREQIVNDPTLLSSTKYNLIVATQGCIDICNHIVAKKGGRAPQDYGDCFRLMADLGILEKDFSDRLVHMVKFRNLLIHLYWEVDNERVYQIVANNLDDFDQFLSAVGKFLQREL